MPPVTSAPGQPADRAKMPGRLVVVAGNICSGKSYLTRALGFPEYVEPGEGTNPWIAAFYADPVQYGEVMQFWILRYRLRTLLGALRRVEAGETVFLDRSIWDDWIFVRANRLLGSFGAEAAEAYERARALLLHDVPFPSAFVYLDASVGECLRRNRSMRQNDCESCLDAPYLTLLEEGYAKVRAEAEGRGVPWFVMPWEYFGTKDQVLRRLDGVPGYPADHPVFERLADPAWVGRVFRPVERLYARARAELAVDPVVDPAAALEPMPIEV